MTRLARCLQRGPWHAAALSRPAIEGFFIEALWP